MHLRRDAAGGTEGPARVNLAGPSLRQVDKANSLVLHVLSRDETCKTGGYARQIKNVLPLIRGVPRILLPQRVDLNPGDAAPLYPAAANGSPSEDDATDE